jgi:hypothetical protein
VSGALFEHRRGLCTEDLDLADKCLVPPCHSFRPEGDHVLGDPRAEQVRVRGHHAHWPHSDGKAETLLDLASDVRPHALQIVVWQQIGFTEEDGRGDAGVVEEREKGQIFLGQRCGRIEEKRRVITSRQVREGLQGAA